MKKAFLHSFIFICFISSPVCRAQAPLFTLYGMTNQGGNNQEGNIFQWPIGGGLFLDDHDFGPGDGAQPWGSLVLANNGLIYGMTRSGGAHGFGIIFSFNTVNDTEIIWHSFSGSSDSDGAAPYGSLIQARNGLLYGMTTAGGAYNVGSIISFNIATDSEQVLYSFKNDTSDAQYAYGSLIQASDTLLYGISQRGGINDSGVIFSFNISTGVETKLHDFGSDTDAAWPSGSLMQANNGLLYGMSTEGGSNGLGAIFSFNIATGKDSVLHSFTMDSTDGREPFGSLIQATNGLLYGMTGSGGTKSDGIIFSYNISTGALSDVYNFGSVSQDGRDPQGALLQASDGKLYGMTTLGGTYSDGIAFSYDLTDSAYTVFDFTGFNAWQPNLGALIEVGGSAKPVLVQSPQAVTICGYDSVAFTAAATGSGITEQWQVSTNGGGTFTNIGGEVDTIYYFFATSAQNGNLYRAIFTNSSGADTTSAAALQVITVSDTATASGAVCTASQTGATYQWLNCSTGQQINGATSKVYTATANGNYKCVVTLSSCTDTTNCVPVTSLGIGDLARYNFSVYPNPSAGLFTIKFPPNQSIYIAEVYNILGEKIEQASLSSQQNMIDLSAQPDGMYLIYLKSGDDSEVIKVMVSH